MSRATPSKISPVKFALMIFSLMTVAVYVLRGIGILGFIPGSIILLLITISIFLGILYSIQITRRF